MGDTERDFWRQMSMDESSIRQEHLDGQMVPDDMEVVEEDIPRLHNEMVPDSYYEEHHEWARDLGVVFDVEYFLGSE